MRRVLNKCKEDGGSSNQVQITSLPGDIAFFLLSYTFATFLVIHFFLLRKSDVMSYYLLLINNAKWLSLTPKQFGLLELVIK